MTVSEMHLENFFVVAWFVLALVVLILEITNGIEVSNNIILFAVFLLMANVVYYGQNNKK